VKADRERNVVVSGVCCSTEEYALRRRLDRTIGEDAYQYNPLTCELTVREGISRNQVVDLVRRAGFGARAQQAVDPDGPFLRRHAEALATAGAALLLLAGMIIGGSEGAFDMRLTAGGAILLGGWKVFRKAVIALRNRSLEINVLMAVAVAGAVAIGKWNEAAAVVVLFSVALMLESYSALRTRRAVQSLLLQSPEKASVLENGKEHEMAASLVGLGTILVVRPGERIPLDGVITEGESFINEAAFTGEATPVAKTIGDTVFGGSLNGRGSLQIRVTRRSGDIRLAHIVHLIEEAQLQRAPVQDFIDRFARVYTPAVFGLALLVSIVPPVLFGLPFVDWAYRSLVLLVIACPCALVISTPVTLVSGLTHAARRGILIKGGRSLEALSKVKTIAFDKTGTLTEGQARVTDIIPLDTLTREEGLQILAGIERHSEHHLASAILQEAERVGVDSGACALDSFEALPGRGVKASIGGQMYFLGNERLGAEEGFLSSTLENHLRTLRSQGKTTMILGRVGEPLLLVAVQDRLRNGAREMVAQLKHHGLEDLSILSGDHQESVRTIARRLGIPHVEVQLLPEEKVTAVRAMGRRPGGVAMVGDGINDAPALAASTVGIAMGVAGSDAALETADVVLMSDDLLKLPMLFSLSQRSVRIIRENIILAIMIKAVFLVLSLAGLSTLWMALLADDGAALAVIANGLRMLSRGDSR
jgi:Cd2+/Zn2+-exporting ATPase